MSRDWMVAIALLVAFPVVAGATYHYLYGLVPGLAMFLGAAGSGLLLLVAYMLRRAQVQH